MTQNEVQEMDIDSDDCVNEPKTLTMLLQQFKDMDLNADINDSFHDPEYNPEAKHLLAKEMLNYKDIKPFNQLYDKVSELDEICTNLDLILMIALLYSGSKEYLKMEEIYKAILLYDSQKLDKKSYIKISIFFKIMTMITTIVNIRNKEFSDDYIAILENDLIYALKICNYLVVDPEIISSDMNLIQSIDDLVTCALTNIRLNSSEIFNICEEFIINLSWNPSKCLEDLSFSLSCALFKSTDGAYHKDIVNYFSQMMMSFLLTKEKPNEEMAKLKKIIPTKIGAIISIFLCSPEPIISAPGMEVILSLILSAKENSMKIWNLFSVISRVWVLKPNDLQKEYMLHVDECINLCIDMYDKNFGISCI